MNQLPEIADFKETTENQDNTFLVQYYYSVHFYHALFTAKFQERFCKKLYYLSSWVSIKKHELHQEIRRTQHKTYMCSEVRRNIKMDNSSWKNLLLYNQHLREGKKAGNGWL